MNNLRSVLPIFVLALVAIIVSRCNQLPRESQSTEIDTTALPEVKEKPAPAAVKKRKIKPEPKGLDTTGLFTEPLSEVIRVAKLHRFYSTRENDYYIALNLKTEELWKSVDSIRVLSDSIIYEDDEIRRTYLPQEIVQNIIDLTKTDTFQLFTMDHRPVGVGHLHHVEYYEDLIESQFVGVLAIDAAAKDENLYGISGAPAFQSDFAVVEISDESIIQSINLFAADSLSDAWAKDDLLLKPDGNTYSIRSYLIAYQSQSIFLKTDNETGVITKLTEINNDYSIMELIPIPLRIHGAPVFLLYLGVPETDFHWYGTATADSTGYRIGGTLISLTNP